MVSPVMVALDVPSIEEALGLARKLSPHVGGFKVGLQLMMSEGPRAVAEVAELGLPVFADAKLHDIPNTVAGAARALGQHGARWVTVHPGGRAMMEAAVAALEVGSAGSGGVLVVAVLTSLDQGDLTEQGIGRSLSAQVEAMAGVSVMVGAEGVVCSPAEIAAARRGGPNLLVVTPGIRPGGSADDDQKRVASPVEALSAGSDWLVVGRPITAAEDPVAAAIELGKVIEASR
jgi:orotidine-5'-phosphate decarboxylase